jgi:hypothetical protein
MFILFKKKLKSHTWTYKKQYFLMKNSVLHCPVQQCWYHKTFIGLGVSPLFFIYMRFLTC